MSQKETASEIERFVLPFFVTSEKGKAPSSSDAELAAVFALAEMNRGKGGRLILRNSQEKISFISKIGYPIWLYPSSNDVFLFDGLNVSEHSVPYANIANVKAFMNDLKESSKKRESLMSFLAEHANYFTLKDKEKSLQLKGLIANVGLLKEFELYRQEAAKSPDQFADFGLLSSRLNESRILSIINETANLRSGFEKEIKDLNFSIQLLGKSSTAFHNELHDEIRAVKEEFAAQIKEEEERVSPIIKALREEYDRKIIDLARMIERQQVPLHTEKLKLEKLKIEVNEKIERYSLHARTVSENDTEGRQRWKQKIKDAKEELSEVKNQLENNKKSIEDSEKKKTSETFHLKSDLETEIKEARSKIIDLEASRDAKILVARQEMDKLESNTKVLSDQISKIVKTREANIRQFEKFRMKPFSEALDKALVYVPFYVISYSSGPKRRYLLLPPSIMSNIGISTRLKAVLGRARIKSFLTARFKEISSLAEIIQKQSQDNTIFETELKHLGMENNILIMGWICEEIEKGLLSLKNQGWITDKEYGAIMASAKANLKQNA